MYQIAAIHRPIRKPALSVLTPFLEAVASEIAEDSLSSQSMGHDHWEWIAVESVSGGMSRKFARLKPDTRLSSPAKGTEAIAEFLNTGLAYTLGDNVLVLDGRVHLGPEFFAGVAEILEDHDVALWRAECTVTKQRFFPIVLAARREWLIRVRGFDESKIVDCNTHLALDIFLRASRLGARARVVEWIDPKFSSRSFTTVPPLRSIRHRASLALVSSSSRVFPNVVNPLIAAQISARAKPHDRIAEEVRAADRVALKGATLFESIGLLGGVHATLRISRLPRLAVKQARLFRARLKKFVFFSQVGYYARDYSWFKFNRVAPAVARGARLVSKAFSPLTAWKDQRERQQVARVSRQLDAGGISARDAALALAKRFPEVDATANVRRLVSEEVARRVRLISSEELPSLAVDREETELRSGGIVHLSDLDFPPEKVREVLSFLSERPVFNAHVPAQSDRIPRLLSRAGTKNFTFGSYHTHDVLQAPHLLELALHPKALSIARRYLGCAPTLYSVHAWWAFPGSRSTLSQDWHRDTDDHRFLSMFIYLTDIPGGSRGGQHEFIPHTHDRDWLMQRFDGNQLFVRSFFPPHLTDQGYNQSMVYEKLFASAIKPITGRAGSVFMADTYAFHRGVPPRDYDRLVCWIRYGLQENKVYRDDETAPLSEDLLRARVSRHGYSRYVTRLLWSEQGSLS